MFQTIMSIFGTLAPLVGAAFGTKGAQIGSAAGTLATNLSGPIVNLINANAAGNSTAADYLAALGILQAALAVLKSTTNLAPNILTQIGDIDSDLQAANVAFISAQGGFNPALYAPIDAVA